MFKRVMLFIATNLAVLLVLSIVLRLLGVDRILDESGTGINYEALLVLSGASAAGCSGVGGVWGPSKVTTSSEVSLRMLVFRTFVTSNP